MSLEEFTREIQGKPPVNSGLLDRIASSDEDGCFYDRAVFVAPLHLGEGLAIFGGVLLVVWASGGEDWQAVIDTAAWASTVLA